LPAESVYTIKELLQQVAEGNEQAFRTIYDAYFNRLAAYVFKLSKSPGVTEEIVQEVFMKLWVKRAVLVRVDNPEAFIFSIARNRTIDFLRSMARDTRLVAVLSERLQQQPQQADTRLSEKELSRLVQEALQQLSEQKKMIYHLSRNEGLSHDEIAEKLQLSKSTVKNNLSATLKHIRLHLERNHGTTAVLLFFLYYMRR
jgi:RNA polymerase sigma-70 factor (family 1)